MQMAGLFVYFIFLMKCGNKNIWFDDDDGDDDFVSQDGQSRTIRQFQLTDWPEQGVPKSGEGFIDFIGQVHKTKEQFGQDGPISVHCRYVNSNQKPIQVGDHALRKDWNLNW